MLRGKGDDPGDQLPDRRAGAILRPDSAGDRPPLEPDAGRRNEYGSAGNGLFDADRPPLGQNGHYCRRTLSHRPGNGRSGHYGERFRSARPRASAAGQGGRRPSPCGAHRGHGRSVSHGGPRPGRRVVRSPRRSRQPGHARPAPGDCLPQQPQDHLDRAAHRLSPRQRKARQPHCPGEHSHARLRRFHDHCLRGEIRNAAADGAGQGTARAGRGAARAIAFVVLHGRSSGFAALRLRQPAPDGPGIDRPGRLRRARLSAAGRSRHWPGRKDQGLRAAGATAWTRSRRTRPWASRPTCATTA